MRCSGRTKEVETRLYTELMAGFAAAGLAVHEVSSILPDWEIRPGTYLIPHDMHPTPWAHDLLAGYVVAEILDHEPRP